MVSSGVTFESSGLFGILQAQILLRHICGRELDFEGSEIYSSTVSCVTLGSSTREDMWSMVDSQRCTLRTKRHKCNVKIEWRWDTAQRDIRTFLA